MAHQLRVEFHSTPAEQRPVVKALVVDSEADRISIRGGLSAGSLGWVLSANVSCRRRTVTLNIIATHEGQRARPGVEDHNYEAMIYGLKAGRYALRVNHVWSSKAPDGSSHSVLVYDENFTAPSSWTAVSLARGPAR